MRRRDGRYMRAFAFALAISLAAAASAAPPRRVVSLNLCTDELLLALAAPDQIVSVTHLAQSPSETPLWQVARRYRVNDGSLLSVAGMHPDLVLTMGGGARDRAGLAAKLGIRAVDVGFPQSLSDLKDDIVQVAAALGRPQAARPILTRIAALERSAPGRQRDTIWIGAGGQTVAATGLAAQWMALAGFRQRAITGDRVSLEQLLVRPPQVLLRSDYRSGQYSNAQRWLDHPLARAVARSAIVTTDGRLWTCMGTAILPEIERLRR